MRRQRDPAVTRLNKKIVLSSGARVGLLPRGTLADNARRL
jgi:hypothetical protein